MVRGEVCTAAFPLAALATVRVPVMPRSLLRPVTDIVSDRVIADAIERMVDRLSADVIHAQTEGFAPDCRTGRAQASATVRRDASRHQYGSALSAQPIPDATATARACVGRPASS